LCLITFRKCAVCKKHAGVFILLEGTAVPFCVNCSRRFDMDPRCVVFVCSVEGCPAAPEFITLLGNGNVSMTFLCSEHFQWCREDLSTVLVISKRMNLEDRRPTDWEVHEIHIRFM
jgi:hypothetical protein